MIGVRFKKTKLSVHNPSVVPAERRLKKKNKKTLNHLQALFDPGLEGNSQYQIDGLRLRYVGCEALL